LAAKVSQRDPLVNAVVQLNRNLGRSVFILSGRRLVTSPVLLAMRSRSPAQRARLPSSLEKGAPRPTPSSTVPEFGKASTAADADPATE
jgi:hypothetical protein